MFPLHYIAKILHAPTTYHLATIHPLRTTTDNRRLTA